ncbi:GCN5 family acetyltransferase [Arthrobacter sp. Soil736]|uniref:GNAT family N-acetyltransferase n=1 Tax=Arthrobacter sp. Soil736 TaxID=1736395 RepID=UPI0006FC226B|nr:GNAT family N-acetyltransferase [Arthrobacter sp. Soil736]KRE66793.1 GCN5 family acetyltransferase [Arthrobacter sp. Soil736]
MTQPDNDAEGGVATAAAQWPDVEQLFGVRGEPSRCWCRFFALAGADFAATSPAERKALLKDRFDGGMPAPGVLAYRDGTPVGWCAVEPRQCYPRILRSQVLKAAGPDIAESSDESLGAADVWSVSCFVVSPGHRRSGVAAALLGAAVEHATAHGATVVEGYPVDAAKRPKAGAPDLYHGTLRLFLEAGFEVVSDAVPGRALVRLRVGPPSSG